MNRRDFLGCLGIGAATLALPSLAKAKVGDTVHYRPPVRDTQAGISIRFVEQYRIQSDAVSRLDVFMAAGGL